MLVLKFITPINRIPFMLEFECYELISTIIYNLQATLARIQFIMTNHIRHR